jgi:DNA-binding response OmpR family regulator
MGSDVNSKQTVLIVEDDKNLVRVLRIVLSASGYSLLIARDGVEGLTQVTQGKPDLIITDIAMPRMDGVEFCRRSREITDAPILVLSGEKNPSRRLEALREDVDEFIAKPCNMPELQERIRKHLSVASPRLIPKVAQS